MRKKRQLTEEQKQELTERLAKARAAKAPAELKTVHPTVRDLPDEDYWSYVNVKKWLKEAKDQAAAAHQEFKMDVKGAKSKYLMWKAYITDIQNYIRTGSWHSDYSGPRMENKIVRKCVAMAYYPNGKPKRDIGTWYPDVQTIWTSDMENDEREAFGLERLTYTPEGHVLVSKEPVKKYKRKKNVK